jgi:recombination DNA repair RAD52 pathway protein
MTVNLDELTKPFPLQAIKQRDGGGGRRFDYVETHTVIHRLNAATGNNWNFEVVSLEWRNDVLLALGRLEIPGHGSRMGIGVQKVSAGGGEDLVKGAASDALKKAATLFGVALELYGPDIEAGEIAQPRQHAPQARQRADTREYPQAADAALHDAQRSAQATAERDFGHATAKQVGFIARLMHELEWSKEDAENYLDMTFGKKRVSDLGSNQDVSAFIDHLLKVKADNEPAPVG